ncbi:hypothetical protein BSU04_04315 [Caballeronia sordidicola]|uniref:Uncharacterized protein n=1 Tax=Caballeronia sordidicola TaxID=196367 RepID=A0A226X9A6_CABSO|nr:hypothetical protein BSU04_04315 [Caballeronia sordidicola]
MKPGRSVVVSSNSGRCMPQCREMPIVSVAAQYAPVFYASLFSVR